ncbi:MAG: hypothetical protein QXP56_07280 [Archaeoglobaceae archaeon]
MVMHMTGFRARKLRFCSVSDIGVWEEKLIWQFKLKHFIYLAISALLLTSSGGSAIRMLLSIIFAIVALMAALYPKRAVSFEAILLGAFYFPFSRRRDRKKLIRKFQMVKEESVRKKKSQIQIYLTAEDFVSSGSPQEEMPAGDSTRSVIEMKKTKIKRV